MTDILDLPGWTVVSSRVDDREYELEAEYNHEPGSRYYPVVPHNGPGSAAPSMVVKCMSCGGMYDKRIVSPGHIRPIAGRERIRNFAVLCRSCNARFHTG